MRKYSGCSRHEKTRPSLFFTQVATEMRSQSKRCSRSRARKSQDWGVNSHQGRHVLTTAVVSLCILTTVAQRSAGDFEAPVKPWATVFEDLNDVDCLFVVQGSLHRGVGVTRRSWNQAPLACHYGDSIRTDATLGSVYDKR